MRIKKPQPFEPGRQYNPGERSVYEILLSLQKHGLPQQNELLKSSECLCIDADVVQSRKMIARLLG